MPWPRVAVLASMVCLGTVAVASEPESICGGLAPLAYECSNGQVVNWNIFEWGFRYPDCVEGLPRSPNPCFVGVLDSSITGAGSTKTKRCHVIVYPPLDYPMEETCYFLGQTPQTAIVWNDCRAYHYASPGSGQDLVPGGAGHWRCVFR